VKYFTLRYDGRTEKYVLRLRVGIRGKGVRIPLNLLLNFGQVWVRYTGIACKGRLYYY
jgi:hypothetical protein